MQKLAILLTHPVQYYAPIFTFIHQRQNIELHVFYSKSGQQTNYDQQFGRMITWDIPLLDSYPYSFIPVENKKDWKFLINRINDWKPDSILVFGWNPIGHLAIMRYFKGKIPIFFRGDSTLINEKPGLKRIVRRIFLKWVYKNVNFAFYVGKNNKDYFQKHGLKESQLIFAPHAIDNNRFFDNQESNYEFQAQEKLRELGLNKEDFIFLYVGKLTQNKKPDLLLKAINQVNQELATPVKLIIVGTGELEEKLQAQAMGNENIRFLGFQNQTQMPIIYRLGEILCLPSKEETWGLVVNEAMACGRPVILSNKVGCAIDLALEDMGNMIFAEGNQKELEQCIKKAFYQKEQLRSQRKIIADFINNWNFEAIVNAIEKAIKT